MAMAWPMPLEAPVIRTRGAMCRALSRCLAGYQLTPYPPGEHHDAFAVVVVHAVGGKTVRAAGELDRLVRFDALGVHKGMQKLTSEGQRGLLFATFVTGGLALDQRLPNELNLGGIAVGEGPARCGRGQLPI